MILKEFRCGDCGDFESLLPLCPKCGAAAKRVFLTAPQINTKRTAPKTDRILEGAFNRMGISNFSNSGDKNRVTWVTNGSVASTVHGQAQSPIQATFAKNELAKYGINPELLTRNGQPYQLPDPSTIAPNVPYGAKVGSFPEQLRQNTEIIGRTDEHGNVTEFNHTDGK